MKEVLALGILIATVCAAQTALTPDQVRATLDNDMRGRAEWADNLTSITGSEQTWSPALFPAISPFPSIPPAPRATVTATALRHKIPKAATKAWKRYSKAVQKSDTTTAAKELEQAIQIDPEFASAHGALGVVYIRQGRNAEAEAHFITAVKLAPNSSTAYSNLAGVFLQKGDVPQAFLAARRALDLASTNASAHLVLGQLMPGADGLHHLEYAARTIPQAAALLAQIQK